MLRVIYTDKGSGIIKACDLDRMIADGKIAAFYRDDGWVHVNLKPVRGQGGTYNGPERRRSSVAQSRPKRGGE